MKKLYYSFAVLGLALGIVGLGCKSIPSNDAMYSTSYAIGVASGMVAQETSLDKETSSVICDIFEIVSECTPETNLTFSSSWTPLAKTHIDKLIADGKLTKAQGVLVEKTFGVLVTGIDYIFEVRFPNAKQYKDIVSAAIKGFTKGCITVMRNSGEERGLEGAIVVDLKAYKWIKKNSK